MPRPSAIGHFELFYLDAEGLSVEQAMASRGSLRAWCKVRPQKKWNDGQVLAEPGEGRFLPCGTPAPVLAQRAARP